MATSAPVRLFPRQRLGKLYPRQRLGRDQPAGGKRSIGVPLLPAELGPDARCAVLLGFGADTSTDPAGWPMTDVSADVYQAAGIRIAPGRANEQTLSQAARCELVLLNPLGDYTPRRITSRYWPYVRLGLPLAVIVDTGSSGPLDRFTGEVDGLYPGWDSTGNVAVVRVTAKGVLSRYGQGEAPLKSPLYRAVAASKPIAWWPLEDGSTATAGAPAAGSASMIAAGTVTFATVTDLAGAVTAPNISQGFLRGLVTGGSAAAWHAEFCLKSDYTTTMAARVYALGGDNTHAIYRLAMPTGAGAGITLYITTPDGTVTAGLSGFSTWTPNVWHHYGITAQQSGSNVVSQLWADGVLLGTDTSAGILAAVGQVMLNQNIAAEIASASAVAVGDGITLSGAAAAVDGYDGEGCWTRFLRLCGEEAIPAAIANGATSGGKPMGPQPVDTFVNLLRQCEAVDGGVMADG